MKSEEFEEQFSEYRRYLSEEVKRLFAFVAIYLQLQERKADQLATRNLAPAFFQTIESSLFSSIILWIDKLLDERSERGLFNFLTFIEQNKRWLSVVELKRRRSYANGHWMLTNRKEITVKSIEADRERIRTLNGLESVRLRRDKFHSHFDKQYFFEREKIAADAPILRTDLEGITVKTGQIVNAYSASFDGSTYSWRAMNISDLDVLLRQAHKKLRPKAE